MTRGFWIRRAAADLACGALLAFLVFQLFRVSGQSDVNPPVCSNSLGNVIECDRDPAVRLIALAVLVGVPVILLVVQVWLRRRPRVSS